MKKIYTILSLFSCLILFSQNQIGKKIQELENQNVAFKPISVLNVTQNSANYSLKNVVTNATFAAINCW